MRTLFLDVRKTRFLDLRRHAPCSYTTQLRKGGETLVRGSGRQTRCQNQRPFSSSAAAPARSTVIAVLAVLVKLTSRGPVFYLQERVGKGGRVFKIVKFRTMTADAESESGPVWATRDDPRETRFGRFLRRGHLDELPQFWNVLKGDMSLIGPRPERPFFVEQFKRDIPDYTERLLVRPGITGWAQVNHDYDRTLDDVRRKVAYDRDYIRQMGWGIDFRIMIATAARMVGRRGGASGSRPPRK
jgi:lipopolysaccharide/colanic/teichoic acid biosynthesis glycosyltransferase